MDKFFKFVALALLLMVSAGTIFAAIPCQAPQQVPEGCGAGCPMMTGMQNSMGQDASMGGASPCCQISSQRQAPTTTQTLPEQFSFSPVVRDLSDAVVIPVLKTAWSSSGQIDLRHKPYAPALLCTFLI